METARHPYHPQPAITQMQRVWQACRRAVVSQCHPAMLLALLLPFVVILLGSILLIWMLWAPLTAWLQQGMTTWPVVEQVDAWLLAVGLVSLQLWLVPILATFILLPLSGIAGVAVAAVFIMPLVLRHLGRGRYADLARRGRFGFATSAWNATWVLVVFCLGWLITMPLWLLPPLALVLPTLWWTFAFTGMLRMDAMVDHASPEERKQLLRQHGGGFWALGFICALLSLLPPAWLILPVFSSLLFAHYALAALRELREDVSHESSAQAIAQAALSPEAASLSAPPSSDSTSPKLEP